MRGRRPPRLAVLFSLLATLGGALAQSAPDAHAHHEHGASDMLLFVSAEAHRYSPRSSAPRLNEDAPVAADLVISLGGNGPLRLFGEFLASSEEHDAERLQLGWEAAPDTVIWFGRYHQPASAWNLEHHHGRYLQTAITRPSVELWEDERGIVPQHLAGLLLETRHDLQGGQALRFALGAGLGVTVADEGLAPLEVLDPRRDGRRVSWTTRLSWLPDQLEASQFGLVAASHRTPVQDPGFAARLDASLLRQDLFGAFADWRPEPWRVQATVYSIGVGARGGAAERNERFEVGYVQLERTLPAAFTAYGRHEDSHGARRSAYLAAIAPSYELRRTLAGLRWDGWRHQALTFEVGRGSTLTGVRWETRLQWSAVFP
jgi:hypothetical protein